MSSKSLHGSAKQPWLIPTARLQKWEKETSWRDQTAGGRAMAGLTDQNAEILMQFL